MPRSAPTTTKPEAVPAVLDLIFGRWRSQITYAGASTGILECLLSGDRSSESIADELGLLPDRVFRLLRALATLGLVKQIDPNHFALCEEGLLLTTQGTPSLRSMLLLEEGPEHYAAWKHLPALIAEDGSTGLEREFGGDAWQMLNANPTYKTVFQEAMSSYSASEAQAIIASVTAADLPSGGCVCDVGGGDGFLVSEFADAFPMLSPTLFDLPAVVDSARERDLAGVVSRIERIGGDMFERVPPADVYLLKHVLHDWNDGECAAILRNLRTHARSNACVLLCEFIIPDEAVPSFASLFDIHMMCVSTGRQRTASELGTLLEQTGWTVGELRPAWGSPLSVQFART